MDLNANDEQLNSPFVFASSRYGLSSTNPNETGTDFKPLFDTIISYLDAPQGDENKPFAMLVSSAEQNDYLGKLAIGKVENGTLKVGQTLAVTNYHDDSI